MFGPARWELENIAIREGVARLVSSLGERILLSEDAYKSLKISDNRMFMGSGDHPGIKVDADDTLFVAAPGVRVTRKVVIEESCVFSGIHFTSTAIEDPNNIDVLVDITTSCYKCGEHRSWVQGAVYWLYLSPGDDFDWRCHRQRWRPGRCKHRCVQQHHGQAA